MKKLNSDPSKSIIFGLDEIQQIAKRLYECLPLCRVMTFSGPLGAGKTTLIRELLRLCGVNEPITSPTFSYLNMYANEAGNQFYHFDLYRVASAKEFCALGFDEYLYMPNSWSFIEWPEHIIPLLDNSVCHVVLSFYDEKRLASITCK